MIEDNLTYMIVPDYGITKNFTESHTSEVQTLVVALDGKKNSQDTSLLNLKVIYIFL